LTEDLQTTLAEVKAMSRRSPSGEGGLVLTLIAPASVGSDSVKRFDRIFDRGFSARAGRGSLSVEILLIRGVCAVVSVIVPLAEGVNVWIGRITVKSSDVDRIAVTPSTCVRRTHTDQSPPTPVQVANKRMGTSCRSTANPLSAPRGNLKRARKS